MEHLVVVILHILILFAYATYVISCAAYFQNQMTQFEKSQCVQQFSSSLNYLFQFYVSFFFLGQNLNGHFALPRIFCLDVESIRIFQFNSFKLEVCVSNVVSIHSTMIIRMYSKGIQNRNSKCAEIGRAWTWPRWCLGEARLSLVPNTLHFSHSSP